MNSRLIFSVAALFALLLAPLARAQYDLKATNANLLYMGTSANPTLNFPTGSNNGTYPVTAASMYRGVGTVAGASGPIKQTTISATYTKQYPANTAKTLVAARTSFGTTFASGVPRYGLGDTITPPLTQTDGITAAAAGYWRQMPVAAGESISNRVVAANVTVSTSSTASTSVTVASVPTALTVGSTLLGRTVSTIVGTTLTLSGNANATVTTATQKPFISPAATVVPVAVIAVSVNNSSTTSTKVTVDSVPAQLIVGVTLLGEPVTKIESNTITLAANAHQTISTSTAVSALPIATYYYSPHAEQVFASQSGMAKVIWVTAAITANGGYETLDDSFAVSSNTSKNLRTIYWTEASFDGPVVPVVGGGITTVNPIYNTVVPKAVATEVEVPGYNPMADNLSTLSYSNTAGRGGLHAYNVEGRIVIEYLGQIRASGGIYQCLGIEVVDLVRSPATNYVTINLGQKLAPHNGDSSLTASPSLSTMLNSDCYGSIANAKGGVDYYAEKQTSLANAPDDGTPASGATAYDKVCFYWMEMGSLGIQWPKFQDRYWQRWSPKLSDYAHYTVDASGSTADTGVSFSSGGISPELIAQDSITAEAQIDNTTQRFFVKFDTADGFNRSLLKFSSNTGVWYQPVYTQADTRQQVLAATANATTTVTVPSVTSLEVGMVVTGTGISGTATLVSITDGTHVVLSQTVSTSATLTFTVQSDVLSPISSTVYVGDRLVPPAGHELGGYISQGTGYYPAGYINPFVSGVAAANLGAIIPVNAVPGNNVLKVRWFKKVTAPSASFSDFYVPGKFGTYTVSYPTAPLQIVIAQGVGTGDLNPDEAAGSVYYQNNSANAGYNPNEEHALLIGTRAYALRDDLNIYPSVSGYLAAKYTSDPYVLLAYTNSTDGRPAIHAYQVLRNNATYDFSYTATAGTLLGKPYPLPLMPEPVVATTGSKDTEIPNGDLPANTNSNVRSSMAYTNFTFKDRKGFSWVHRGPHDAAKVLSSKPNGTSTVTVASTSLSVGMAVTGTGITGTATITSIPDTTHVVLSQTVATSASKSWTYTAAFLMKLYYLSRDGFYIPGATSQPAADTVLPFLRNAARSGQTLSTSEAATSSGATDEPLAIIYRPAWPTDAPQLMVGETLALPKYGLPQVRGQSSAEVYYQQSIAKDTTASLTKASVTLVDPTREKTVAIDASGVALTKLPTSIATSTSAGKTYFQGLPPHLQQRFYFDPLRGTKGTLVFKGVFHDEAAGEKYFDLNLLSAADSALLKGLVVSTDTDKTKWDNAINKMKTTMQTFIADPSKLGTFKVDSYWDVFAVPANASATTVANGSTASLLPRSIAEIQSWTTTKSTANGPTLATVGHSDTAVDSYAVTATGQGTGYVTMVFGNGVAFTPQADPLQVKVFKVADQLYTGDLKVITSSNPLDEQVTLRHSADFAGRPEDYDFQWRWATGEASAPATYSYTIATQVGDATAATDLWYKVSDPGALLPSDAQYAAATTAVQCPRSEVVRPATYTDAEIAANHPSLVFKSTTGVNFSTGVPGSIYFSANLGNYDGCVLYVNGQAALAYNAPSPQFASVSAATGLTVAGLSKQFSVEPRYFIVGVNRIEVAVYSTADVGASSSLNFKIESMVETDNVATGSTWQTPTTGDTNTAVVGGKSTNPFGGPTFVLNDRWFTVRYRPKLTSANVLTVGKANQDAVAWSRWTPPQFTEGWIKRVLAAINPYEQRVKDLYSNAISTNVSVITQAGTRWEGDVALTMDNINSTGLISIYETVLNRAKAMSIDATPGVNDPDTNNALILAAGYLNDLYTILGNEAYADAANPTISINDSSSAAEVNTSRFSFEGQVASSLDEELALLRGRDDSISPGVRTTPAYNRLYWNYTHGISSGEAIYATNYNIKEKTGSTTANGVIDESDAQNMFPQGHGDAYGHYLTALTGYYRLLHNANFTWTPRAEAVTVLGQAVTVDFQDERKFAAAANNVARTSQQICALTYRQNYKDDAAGGWTQFRDSTPLNAATGVTRHWALDEEVSRGAQGALLHWAMANALLPDVDTYHSGVQKIDRTTVPEIGELASAIDTFQTTLDNASSRLNPLGLSPGSIAFDIDPYFASSLGQELSRYQGQSQFLQLYDRSLRSLNNAAGAFNQAAVMSRSLRNQEDQVDDYTNSISEQESSYVNQLIEIFGRPYQGEVGPGKTYDTTYNGPDLEHWYVVDRPFAATPLMMVDTSSPSGMTASVRVRTSVGRTDFTGGSIQDIISAKNNNTQLVSVTVTPNQFIQFSDQFMTGMGTRPETGELQTALLDAQLAYLEMRSALLGSVKAEREFQRESNLVLQELDVAVTQRNMAIANSTLKLVTAAIKNASEYAEAVIDEAKPKAQSTADAIAEFFPRVVGVDNDATAPARGTVKTAAVISNSILTMAKLGNKNLWRMVDYASLVKDEAYTLAMADIAKKLDMQQQVYEFEVKFRDLTQQIDGLQGPMVRMQQANQNVVNVLAKANRVLTERETFRMRAGAIIQGYRTKDVTFRLFRNEALEQYRSLFDLASRYTYLSAKAYDFETALLGSATGQKVFDRIVAARSLGDLTGGVPQATVSTLGDAGLAGTMAQLNADFSVAEGRLGINNPDYYGTVFSLRQELFRIQDDPDQTSDDDAWKQTLEQHVVSNVMNDADVVMHCRNIQKTSGTAVPGIIIPFSSTIEHGKNFFGLDLAAFDHAYSASSYATKISNAGIVFPGYLGMDASISDPLVTTRDPATSLSATPYVYLIPCGNDTMRAPPLGDMGEVRTWSVQDQALPLPYNLGASAFNSNQFFNANGTLNEQPWVIRKHQAFRAVGNAALFQAGAPPLEFSSNRLIARSAWNSRWKIIIPAYTLSAAEQDGLNRFVSSVTDIQLYLRTYSHSGN